MLEADNQFWGGEVGTNFWGRTTSHKESSKYVPEFFCTGTKDQLQGLPLQALPVAHKRWICQH